MWFYLFCVVVTFCAGCLRLYVRNHVYSQVQVTEWSPLGKELLTKLAVCSLNSITQLFFFFFFFCFHPFSVGLWLCLHQYLVIAYFYLFYYLRLQQQFLCVYTSQWITNHRRNYFENSFVLYCQYSVPIC